MRIGFLGSGLVGRALARGWAAHGHEVRIGTRQDAVEDLPVGRPDEVVQDAELVVLAVQGSAAVDLVASLVPALDGRVLVDATNPLAMGGSDSLRYASTFFGLSPSPSLGVRTTCSISRKRS